MGWRGRRSVAAHPSVGCRPNRPESLLTIPAPLASCACAALAVWRLCSVLQRQRRQYRRPQGPAGGLVPRRAAAACGQPEAGGGRRPHRPALQQHHQQEWPIDTGLELTTAAGGIRRCRAAAGRSRLCGPRRADSDPVTATARATFGWRPAACRRPAFPGGRSSGAASRAAECAAAAGAAALSRDSVTQAARGAAARAATGRSRARRCGI